MKTLRLTLQTLFLVSFIAFLALGGYFGREGTVLAQTNLLSNPGFESETTDWTKYPGTATIGADGTNPRSGSYAGYITKTNDSIGAVDMYQDVSISEAGSGIYYTLKGYVLYPSSQSSNFNNVRLRIQWYDSSSSEIGDPVEGSNASTNDSYQQLSIIGEEAPSGAVTARVMLHVNLRVGQTDLTNLVLWDDLLFYRSGPNAVTLSTFAAETFDVTSPSPWLAAALAATATLALAGLLWAKRRRLV